MPGFTIPPLPRLPVLQGTNPKRTHRTDPVGGFASTVKLATFNMAVWAVGLAEKGSNHAVLHLLVSLPLILQLISDRPRAAVNAGREAQDVMQLHRAEQRTFMIMAAILVTFGLAVTIVSMHRLTLLQAQGLSLSDALAIGLWFGPAQDVPRRVEMAGWRRHHPVLASCLRQRSGWRRKVRRGRAKAPTEP
ncbi:hypothetical protein ACFOHI_18335 [Paracoccus aerius]